MILLLIAVMSVFSNVTLKRVHDGDTVIVDIANFPKVFGENMGVRIKGIDSPELNDAKACVRRKAEKARDALTDLLSEKPFALTHCEKDKFFRLLCNIFISESVDAGSYMLEKSLARPYSGEAKKGWNCR